MRHDSFTEERSGAQARAIEELVGHQKIEWRQIVAKRTHSANGDDSLCSQHLQRENIRAIGYVARRKAMAACVAREKSHAPSFQSPYDESVRSIAERRLYADFSCIRETGHRVETASTDNADFDCNFLIS